MIIMSDQQKLIMPVPCTLGWQPEVPEWWRCTGKAADHRGPHINLYGHRFTTEEAQAAGARFVRMKGF